MSPTCQPPSAPFIGIIMLDTVFPRIKGDIGNPDSFDFPVEFETVTGASPERIVIQADTGMIQPFIEAGQRLINRGARAIATSCGFLALFHKDLVAALEVPVFSSALLQAHTARAVIGPDKKIGIITARKTSLTRAHLAGVGIEEYPLAIVGMESAEEFTQVFIQGSTTLNRALVEKEMQQAAQTLIQTHPDVDALVLECTNMPPYTRAVKEIVGPIPVFDCLTMMNHVRDLVFPR